MIPSCHPTKKHKARGLCKSCYDAKRYQKNPGPAKERRRANDLRRFGISEEIYRALEIAQQGECAICGKQETALTTKGKVRKLAVDHNHETGEVRGLLCWGCNRGLGSFLDNPIQLRLAANYLEAVI